MKALLLCLLLNFFQSNIERDIKFYLRYSYKNENFKSYLREKYVKNFYYFFDEYSKRYLEKKPYLKKYYLSILDACKEAEKIYHVPPILALVLIENESKGNALAISDAGAAGLMQIALETAEELGMKVYRDENYEKYKEFWKKYKEKEKEFFENIESKNSKDIAYEALKNKYLAREHIKKYKENLRKNKDERFGEKGIYKGIAHLAFLLKKHKGNIVFALAEYNAGSIAGDYGIPPFEETVRYISRIMKDLQEVGFDKFVIENKKPNFFFNPFLLNKFEYRKEFEKNFKQKLEEIFLYKK
jgi:hypothetical protein